MSRQLRLEFPGAIWHVTSRGNERRDIFRDDDDRHRFVSLLGRAVAERRWLLHGWVLMSNHYHLMVETPEIGLSRGVKWLNQSHVEAFNTRYDRVGHLFQGRFKGILVERQEHLLELLRYIVLNPVRSQMVRYAGDYAWSNYRATAGLQPAPSWLEVDWTLGQFGPSRRAAQIGYRRFVAEGRESSYNPWEAVVGQIYLGGEGFCDRVQELVDAEERSPEYPRAQRRVIRPAFDAVIAAVSASFQVAPAELRLKSRGLARKALTQLAADEAGLPLQAIASWMGVTKSAASKMRRSAQELYANDALFRARIDRIRDELSQLSRCDP